MAWRGVSPGRKAELIARFSRWDSPIASVLEATPDGVALRNDVFFLEPLPRWSHGKIVLLRDAAHATTPGVGQGAAQGGHPKACNADNWRP
jgi:2-polyprenyl-6-methoxyphenol hydroxylase-like FAD-dependent oxidoreductase